MNTRPTILNQVLTGGVTYDAITLPERVMRLCISSLGSTSALKIKFGGSTYLQLETGQQYDSDWISHNLGKWEPEISINGTGTVQVEYWA